MVNADPRKYSDLNHEISVRRKSSYCLDIQVIFTCSAGCGCHVDGC